MRMVSHWNKLPREAVDVLPGSIPGQVRWAFEQRGLVEGVPVQGRGYGTR